MLVPTAISLFATTLLFSSATAAPTRTHCRCTIVADAPPSAVFSPSAAHWSPAEVSSSPAEADICSNLGPELENFQHTEPNLYESYISRVERPSTNNDEQRPLTTNVFVNFAASSGLRPRNSNKEPRPTSRPHQRIECRSEPDPFTEYQGSFVTLWALQIIIAFAILACIAEGVHQGFRWYTVPSTSISNNWASRLMRLPGSERLILQISASTAEEMESEKTMRPYEATPVLIVQAPNGDRVCISYDEDDDDEMNRPVM